MERRHSLMIRASLILLAFLIPASWSAERSVVLAVSNESPVQALDAHDVRMLFLGHTVRIGGRTLAPIRNMSEAAIDNIFLQSVVAMSATRYDRYTLRIALQQGRPRPLEIRDSAILMSSLEQNPLGVSYFWETEARANPRLRILRVLWRE